MLAMLLDHYFLCVLSLFTVRAWDEGDASENLERVTRMLAFPGTHIGSLNVNWRTSPESSVFAKPGPLSVSTAEVEVGAIVSGTVENVAVVGVGFRALARSVTGVSVFEI